MAKEENEEKSETREFGEDERVETSTVDDDTDIFAEIAGTPKTEKLKKIVEKYNADVVEDDENSDEEEDEDDDDEEEEDSEDEKEEIKESEEEEEPPQKPAKKTRQKKVKEEPEEKEEMEEEKIEEKEIKKEKKSNEEAEEEIDDDNEEYQLEDDDFENDEAENADDVDLDAKEPEELKQNISGAKPSRDEIRKTILEKAVLAGDAGTTPMGEKLEFLNDKEKKSVFIGRKANIFKKYGYEAALHIGRVHEEEYNDYEVYLDSMNPHVVFVCGARGSGKSYVLGVIAEELADKNKNVGIIVVDPIGVFWSMRFPNKEEKEIEKLKEWGLSTSGLKNMKVFIPDGMKKEVPKSTYDAGFSILPSLLTGEDWALTFGVDRFSVSGLLLEKVLKKVEKGYKHKETNKKIPGKGKKYSLEDLINCLEYDSELNSRDKGYKPDSIRAISSRFEAAKSWGIFSEKGTPLGELSRENQMTVLDTSFLEDNVTALVIGILSRRLLSARKISTRKEAASKFKSLDMNELLEMEIPPTWLFIDEAHTLIPSGNEVTPATAGLIEYVKQGRRPGLSLVFATQQPSAINTKVLSQLDVIMSHKLIFDDDIKAVFKRTPTIMPKKYRVPNFIKTLPVGIAVTGDRSEETSRAFVMAIRPRKSQHEGRDAETSQMGETLSSERVKEMAVEMLFRDVKANEIIEIQKAELAVGTLNNRYGTNIDFNSVLKTLSEKGLVVANGSIMAAGYVQEKVVDEIVGEETEKREDDAEEATDEEAEHYSDVEAESEKESETEQEESSAEHEMEEEAETTELLSLPQRINEAQARQIVEKVRKKKLFGFFGNSDRIESIQKRFFPIWKINFDVRTRKNEFIARECYINSLTGEFMHFNDGNFIESKGLAMMNGLSEEEVAVFKGLQKQEVLLEEIMAQNTLDESQARRILQKLMEKGLVSRLTEKKTQKQVYWAKIKLDLPPNERHELLGSLSRLPFVRAQALSMERERISKDQAIDSLKKLWPSVVVKKTEVLHKPIWHVVLSEDAREKTILVDAVNGKIL